MYYLFSSKCLFNRYGRVLYRNTFWNNLVFYSFISKSALEHHEEQQPYISPLLSLIPPGKKIVDSTGLLLFVPEWALGGGGGPVRTASELWSWVGQKPMGMGESKRANPVPHPHTLRLTANQRPLTPSPPPPTPSHTQTPSLTASQRAGQRRKGVGQPHSPSHTHLTWPPVRKRDRGAVERGWGKPMSSPHVPMSFDRQSEGKKEAQRILNWGGRCY